MNVVVEYGDYKGIVSDYEKDIVLTNNSGDTITVYHFKVISIGSKKVHIWHSGEILYTLDFNSHEQASLLEVTEGYLGVLIFNIIKKDLDNLVFTKGSVTCNNCGSKIHNKYWQKRGNISDAYIQMMCPVCHKVSTIATEGLRDYILEPIEDVDIHKVKPAMPSQSLDNIAQGMNINDCDGFSEYNPFKMGDQYDSSNKHNGVFNKHNK